MRLNHLFLPIFALGLAACGAEPVAESNTPSEAELEEKAQTLDVAADRLPSEATEEVLENQAEALRNAAEGEAEVDAEGSVTVVKE